MPVPVRLLCVALLLTAAAGSLRFAKLGAWPFAFDETATLQEADVLFGGRPADPDSQAYRLPRVIPLGYWLLHAGYEAFGRDEFGSRAGVALLGTLLVPLAFLALAAAGRPGTGLAAALLLALSPEHVSRAQENRFYTAAALFAAVAFLAGAAVAWRSNRAGLAAAVVGLAALAAMLCHTLAGLGAFAVVVAAALVAWWVGGKQFPGVGTGVALTLGAVALAGVALFYVRPLVAGWNAGESWGYSPPRAVAALVLGVGWPVFLLAGLGLVTAWREDRAEAAYWGVCVASAVGAAVALPLIVSYHPGYAFPLEFGLFVLAGRGVAAVAERLRAQSLAAAGAWACVALALNLPSLASHYADGSRYDVRSAAQFVATHRKAGDAVVAKSSGLVNHYAPRLDAAPPKPDLPRAVEAAARDAGRVWVVVQYGRGGLEEAEAKWLGEHCTRPASVRKARYDYRDYVVDVYLYDRRAPAGVASR